MLIVLKDTFPIGIVLLSIIVIFIVVFGSMFYALHKQKEDNIIEILKNENI